MKLYRLNLNIVATAYVKGNSEQEAIQKAQQHFVGYDFEVPFWDGDPADYLFSNLPFNDPNLPECSLSPAMSIFDIYPEIEEVSIK